ncbi:hypothetical protein [Bacillus salipaludis]|uniref:Uncharacterized protein n=1 Tax=Bacillus salipaludis TaxID=2547811 RepID=A0AA90QUL6_9BACI|nr:hypothetical protein [Bacillus salipaludis]MDQ6595102.1 hypothetical protein [Bacillus salipaludis]
MDTAIQQWASFIQQLDSYPTIGDAFTTIGHRHPTIGELYTTIGHRYPTMGGEPYPTISQA